jgi:hypothetical protein
MYIQENRAGSSLYIPNNAAFALWVEDDPRNNGEQPNQEISMSMSLLLLMIDLDLMI